MMTQIKQTVTEANNTTKKLAVTGYVDGSGVSGDLQVEMIGRDGYHQLLRDSLTWVADQNTPPAGTEQSVWDTARFELQNSWSGSLARAANGDVAAKGMPLTSVPGTGYYTREDRPGAIFLVHLKSLLPRKPDTSVSRTPVTAAKKLLIADAPVGAYMGMIILEPGKCAKVEVIGAEPQVTADNYAAQAMRTAPDLEGPYQRVGETRILDHVHASLGLSSDLAELNDVQNELDRIEELGDLFWFTNLGLNACKTSFSSAYARAKEYMLMESAEIGWQFLDIAISRYANHVKAVLFGGKTEFKLGAATLSANQRLEKDLLAVLTQLVGYCATHKVAVNAVLAGNIAKLKTRYPGEFSEAAFANRDKVKEIAALAAAV
jgi:hypothetical protein